MTLLVRAMLAFLICPGTVAFFVPIFLLAPGGPGSFVDAWALIPLAGGAGLLLWCVWEFYSAGRGTLAPWPPPQELVESGPYRFSRNPMYIAVLLLLCGWALGFRSRTLVLYAVAFVFAFHLRVVLYEEPWLARTHGEKWTLYKAHVPRWVW
jgi:protein-S-isoprenylcysteine O-methyltransferase Ste14